jgi:signal transduction histidine kinase
MATLRLIQGPHAGSLYPLEGRRVTLGRQSGVDLFLDSVEVSRRHARVTREGEHFFLEDLGSSNGTYLNGTLLAAKTELRPRDRIGIGPFLMQFEAADDEEEAFVRASLSASAANRTLFQQDAAGKLTAVLEITQHLARTLDLDDLFPRLLDRLLNLFPQADRGLVLLREGDGLVTRSARFRTAAQSGEVGYSRSVVRRVLEEGVGVLAVDAGADQRFAAAETLAHLGIRSFLCAPFMDHDGRPLGVVQLDRLRPGTPFSLEDLHLLTAISLQVSVVLENAALHARLLEQERVKRDLELARLSQLVAGIAHEINNPLAFVSNNLAVFGRELGPLHALLDAYREADAALAEHRPEVLRQVRALAEEADPAGSRELLSGLLARSADGLRRIGQIVNDLREFARLDRGELDEVDLNAGIETALNVVRGRADRQGVALEFVPGPLPRVECYPAKVNQVVYHLLANAIDACTESGRVTVRTQAVPDGVEVAVSDSGCGIDPSVRGKVFDPFFTTKPLGKGAGLGLSISYGIVRNHGGTIELDSTPGKGTTFTVRLPLRPPSVSAG